MKFILRSVSGDFPDNVGVKVTVHRTFTTMEYPANPKHLSELKGEKIVKEYDEQYIIVDINTLEDLIVLSTTVRNELIFSPNYTIDGLEVDGTITIYDDYM